MIQGTAVKILNRSQVTVDNVPQTDGFGMPVYTYGPNYETVEGVLIGQPTPEERVADTSLYGRMTAYVLGIPKGDVHDWQDQVVEFFGHKWQTIGIPEEGIEANIPTRWHKKVKVVRYE